MIPLVLFLLFQAVQCNITSPTSSSEPETPVTVHNDWYSLFGGNMKSVVQLLRSGEKSYYLGVHFKATYFQAIQLCQDIRMKLVSIETHDENDILYKYVRDTNKGALFWTSGTKLLDGKHWIWMSYGKPVDYTNWAQGNPDNHQEHCIAASHKKNVGLLWTDKSCLVRAFFICERRSQNSSANYAESEMSMWRSVYENPYMSANIPLFHTNHKSYFLGRYFKATFQEAVQICEQMSMHLVAIMSEEENQRIYKYIRDTNAGSTFWTSGTRMIDGVTWVWMTTAQLVDYTNWSPGQPDSLSDKCIQLVVRKDKGMFWVDSSCWSRFYYICEKPKDLPVFERRTTPASENTEGHSQMKKKEEPIKMAEVPLIQTETRTYYLGNDLKLTQWEASNYCQRIQMQLINITTDEEYENIRELLLQHSTPSDSFWTSITKSGSTDTWSWSSLIPAIYSKINSEEGHQNSCIEIFHNATWSEQLCGQKRFFICEKTKIENLQ